MRELKIDHLRASEIKVRIRIYSGLNGNPEPSILIKFSHHSINESVVGSYLGLRHQSNLTFGTWMTDVISSVLLLCYEVGSASASDWNFLSKMAS